MPRAAAGISGRLDLDLGQLRESFPPPVPIAASLHPTPAEAWILQITH